MARRNPIESSGENIIHFGSVRLRVTGGGDLKIGAFGLKDTLILQLADLPVFSTTDVEPMRLLNVSRQRLSFEIKVTEFNEWFNISRFIIYSKPIYTQGPNL